MLKTCIQADERGVPRLYINGKKEAPVIFYGCTLFEHRMRVVEKEFQMAAEAGIHLYSVILKMGVMPEERQESIDKMSRYMDMILQYDPEAKILVRANVSQYGKSAKRWAEMHPDDGIRFEYQPDIEGIEELEDFDQLMTSVFSEGWRETAEETLRLFARYFANHPLYSEHFLGYHLGGNESDEWFHYAYREAGCDVSPAAQKYFRKFVTEKYHGDVQALRTAWGDDAIDFEQVAIPCPIPGNTPHAKPYPTTYFSTPQEQKYVDYNEMLNVRIAQLIAGFSRIVKEETHRNTLVMCFYGYLFELCGDPRSGHMALQQLLDCPDVDGFASPCGYWDRDVGGTGQYMTVIDSVVAHGKMWFVENDIRTFLRYRRDPDQPIKLEGFANIFSFVDLYEVYRREAGTQMVRGCASWYMDLAGEGWFLHPDFWEEIKALEELCRVSLEFTTPYRPELAVVVDPEEFYRVPAVSGTFGNTMFNVRTQCYRLGVAAGFYTMEDWLNGKADHAKMVLLFNPSGLKGEKQERALKKIRRPGQTTFFFYGFGDMTHEEMRALTGMDIRKEQSSENLTTAMQYCNEWDGFVNTSGGCGAEVPTRYYVAGGSTGEWARYLHSDKVGFAACEKDGYRTIFFGGFETNKELLGRVTEIAGLFQYGYFGEYVLPGPQLYVTHTSSPGEKTVYFPQPCDVYDYFEDTWYMGVDHITKTLDVGKTSLYFHGKREEIERWNLPRWTREYL